MRKMASTALLAGLALLLAACGFGGVVIGNIVTGPTVTQQIDVPGPSGGGTTQVVIGMGGGELNVTAGSIDRLVQGTVAYNVTEIKPSLLIQDGTVDIEQGDVEGKRVPIGNWSKVVNRWNLTLGTAPISLTVNAGAAKATLSRLAALDATAVDLHGGAAQFTLDFSGTLRQNMQVLIEVGAAQVVLVVPQGTPAQLTFEGALTDIRPQGAWTRAGSQYSQPGEGPRITFVVKMGVGRLDLRNR